MTPLSDMDNEKFFLPLSEPILIVVEGRKGDGVKLFLHKFYAGL